MKLNKSKNYSVVELMDILGDLHIELAKVRLQKGYSYTKEYHTLSTQIKYYERRLKDAMNNETL